MRHRPLFIWPMVDPVMWDWGTRMLLNCNERRVPAQQGPDGADLELQPRRADRPPRPRSTLDFDLRQQGTLQLFRTEKQLKGSKADQEVLAEYDSPFEVLDRDGCIAAEPGLALVADKFVGGLRLTGGPHRRLPDVHAGARRQGGGDRRELPLRGDHRGARLGGRADHRRADRPRHRDAPTPMSARSGPMRRSCCAASASGCRSTRSRATRSRFRSPTTGRRRSRP